MVSQVSICNRALSQVGTRSNISAMNENSNEAQQCSLLYQPTVEELLQMAHWNFARKTETLSLLKSAPGTPTNPTPAQVWTSAYPSPPWLYEYAVPSDCLQMQMIVPQMQAYYLGTPIFPINNTYLPAGWGPPVPFQLATDRIGGNQRNVILTDQYQAIGIYTMMIDDPTLYEALFVQGLVMALAAKLALSLTGDKKLASMLFSAANEAVIQARASDGNAGLTVIDNMPDWITIRETGPYSIPMGPFIAPYGPLYGVV